MRHHTWFHAVAPAGLVAMAALLTSTFGASTAVARQYSAGPPRGGTIHVGFSGSVVTLDPSQAYNDDWWLINGTLFNGLYQFDRQGVPQRDLADGPPTISADRTVWTFRMHKGVRFSNGMEATANDLQFAITRSLDPHTKPAPSWGQATDTVIKGASEFAASKAKSVSGIEVLNRYTIRFTLIKPIAIFPYILAETFNMIVPKAVVTKEGDLAFSNHPIGTGPFMLRSWQKGVGLVFERNPYYFHSGKPYVDKLVVSTNIDPGVLALKVEKGEIDGFGDDQEVAAPDVRNALADPTYARDVTSAPTVLVVWIDLDVHVAPLDKLAIRQAVALAIDRRRLVRLLGGIGLPASQLYVPTYPQYDPTLDRQPVYPYDRHKAAALVKASGYHGQPITVLYANNIAYQVSMAPGLQQDLQRVGLTVSLRAVTDSSLVSIGAALTGHQIQFDDWTPDYLDGYDTYSLTMSCEANAAGGIGRAHYCDHTADSIFDQATGLPLGAERNALMRQAQVRILQSASRIPLVFLKSVELVSPRVGGFYYQPMFGWQYENYWLKR